jgi:glycosyltransferase involved in cell wall biosynthesis
MRCPTLKELPSPPRGKTGWPWTEESLQLPDTMPDGKPWPKISIVTPNYNYSQFIEETIRSVLLQGYPNLEYIIIDDGSTDNSIEIIKKYSKWLTHWEKQENRGQGHTINKGFKLASADLFTWINSDDIYEKNALSKIAPEFSVHPQADVISGICRLWAGKQDDEMIGPSPLRSYEDFLCISSNWIKGKFIVQPEAFFRRRAYELAGGIPEDLHYVLDVALWMRMARRGCIFHSINEQLARLRLHESQHSFDAYSSFAELCCVAWCYLRQDWDMFAERAPLIAEDIFNAQEEIMDDLKKQFETIKNSTSYRVGRLLTQLKFW